MQVNTAAAPVPNTRRLAISAGYDVVTRPAPPPSAWTTSPPIIGPRIPNRSTSRPTGGLVAAIASPCAVRMNPAAVPLTPSWPRMTCGTDTRIAPPITPNVDPASRTASTAGLRTDHDQPLLVTAPVPWPR